MMRSQVVFSEISSQYFLFALRTISCPPPPPRTHTRRLGCHFGCRAVGSHIVSTSPQGQNISVISAEATCKVSRYWLLHSTTKYRTPPLHYSTANTNYTAQYNKHAVYIFIGITNNRPISKYSLYALAN